MLFSGGSIPRLARLGAGPRWRCDAKHLVAGMCETDYSGYPDRRDDTIQAIACALNRGMVRDLLCTRP
jgi:7-cyano-7-deazaguanine synthase